MTTPDGDCSCVEVVDDGPGDPGCVPESVATRDDACETSLEVLAEDTTEENALMTSVSEGKNDEASSLLAVTLDKALVPSEAEGSIVALPKPVVAISEDVDTDAPVLTNVGDGASTKVDEVGARLTDTIDVTSTDEEVNMSVSLGN